jgi:murein DD-endopeptidase MepM/ murein hydrolase activator NlpD
MDKVLFLKDRRVITAFSVIVALIALILSVASLGLSEILGRVLELRAPTIRITSDTHGLNLAGARLEIDMLDYGAGLDDYSIKVKQKATQHEDVIAAGNLNGAHKNTVNIILPGTESSLVQGEAIITINASDRSIWNNTTTYEHNISVDLERPQVEIIEIHTNILQGSTYFPIIRASDNSQRIDMVLKIGSYNFRPYPAKGLDRIFDDPNLYVIPFTYPLDEDPTTSIPYIMAEDAVGNGTKILLDNLKIVPRQPIAVDINVDTRYLRDSAKQIITDNTVLLEEFLALSGGPKDTLVQSNDNRFKDFKVINELLTPISERRLYTHITASRFDRYWFRPFIKPEGQVRSRFMAIESYINDSDVIGKHLSRGYTIALPIRESTVKSLGDGVIMYSGDCGSLGSVCIAIDHGLGIVSIFGMLESALVQVGQRIEAGTPIGTSRLASTVLSSGLDTGRSYYVELDVQGVPAEIRDWWNNEWFMNNISTAINSAKSNL